MTELNKLTWSVDFDTTKFDKKIKKLKKKIKREINMKYKVGDKVKVRADLDAGVCYGIYANNEMVTLAGKTVTISEVNSTDYFIEESEWWWNDEMFSGLAEDKPKYYVQVGSDFLNHWIRQGVIHEVGDISLNTPTKTTYIDTEFTVKKGLKLLREYAKNHYVDLTTVKFIPVEEPKPETKKPDLFIVTDTSKPLGEGVINRDNDGEQYVLLDGTNSCTDTTHLTKNQAIDGIKALKDKLDLESLRIVKVEN